VASLFNRLIVGGIWVGEPIPRRAGRESESALLALLVYGDCRRSYQTHRCARSGSSRDKQGRCHPGLWWLCTCFDTTLSLSTRCALSDRQDWRQVSDNAWRSWRSARTTN